jgi:uncharacterized protein DUF3592
MPSPLMTADLAMPPAAPRPFRLGAVDASTKFLLLFGAIWAFVGTLISVVFTVAGGSVLGDVALDRRGVTTQATPVSVEPTASRVNGRRVYRITYTFTDEAGAPRASAAGTTNGDTLARAHRREPLPVQYDPQRPSLSRLVGESASFFGWFVLFPLAFAVIGWTLCLRGLRRVLRVREVYVHGVPVRAEVTEVSATSMRINRRRVMRVAYAFDAITKRATGSTTSLAPPPVGTAIWVLHLPSQPDRNVAVLGRWAEPRR